MSGLPYIPFISLPWAPPQVERGRDRCVGRAECFEPGGWLLPLGGAADVLLGDEDGRVHSTLR